MKFLSDILAKASLTVEGVVTLNNTASATVNTNKFVVLDGSVVKIRTAAQVLADIGAQATLTNPITGTGTSGQVAYFNGTNSITSESNLFWDSTNGRLGIGTVTPTWALEVKKTLTDAWITASRGANNVHAGILFNPNGAWSNSNLLWNLALYRDTNDLRYWAWNGSSDKIAMSIFGATSNVLLAGGNSTATDAGFRLDVNGTARVQGVFTTTADAVINTITVGLGGGAMATNTSVGYQAGAGANSGIGQGTFFGYQAGNANTTGAYNVFLGYKSGFLNTTGYSNVVVGNLSLSSNVSGYSNTAIGQSALQSNTGNYNTAIGHFSLQNNTSAANNTSIGGFSLTNNTGANNTSIGASSLYSNTTGNNNTSIGQYSLNNNTTGAANTAIGRFAGTYISGGVTANTITNNSIFIGYDTRALADNQTNQIVIGYAETGLGSNTTILGNSSTVTTAIRGRLLLGSTTDDGSNQLQVTGSGIFTGILTESNNYFYATGNSNTGGFSFITNQKLSGNGTAFSAQGGAVYSGNNQSFYDYRSASTFAASSFTGLKKYGFYFLNQITGTTGTVAENYGVYIEAPTLGTLNVGLYNGGTSTLIGNTLIGTTTDAGYRLDVNGTARFGGITYYNASSGVIASIVGGSNLFTIVSNDSLTISPTVLTLSNTTLYFSCTYIRGVQIQVGNFYNFSTSSSSGATGLVKYFNLNGTCLTQSGGSFRIINLENTLSNDNNSQTFIGIYYNPTITGLIAGTNHRAIETVTGNNLFGTTSGETVIGSSTTSGAKLTIGGSVTAAFAIARGAYFNNTLVAAANSDVLVGLDINPSFTNGAFTGVSNYALRVNGTLEIIPTTGLTFGGGATAVSYLGNILHIGNNSAWTQLNLYAGTNIKFQQTSTLTSINNTIINIGTANMQFAGVGVLKYSGTDLQFGSVDAGFNSTTFYSAASIVGRYYSTGNWFIGSSPTDAGYKLDVNGTARVQDTLTLPKNISISGTTAVPQIAGTVSYASSINGQLNGTISTQSIASLYVNVPTYTGTGSTIIYYSIYAGMSYFDRINVGLGSVSSNIINDSSTAPLRLQGYNALTGASGVGTGSLIFTSRTSGTQLGIAATYGGGGSRLYIFNEYNDGPTSRILINMAGVNTACFFTDGSLQIGNGETTIASALLSATSTTRGFLPPRMTTTQRDAIASPATGLQVYNTTTNTNDFYNGTAWTSGVSGTYVTSVTGTSPIVSSGGTTPAISIPVATTSVNGYLSSTDWTTFNNKASTASLANYLPLAGGTLTGALSGTSATFSSTVQSIGQIVYSPTLGYVSTSYQSYAGATTWYVGAGSSGVSIQPFVIGRNGNGNSADFNISSTGNVSIGNDTDTGDKLYLAGNLKMITNGKIDSNGGYLAINSATGGNVLIGTTTNANYKLDVNGTGRFSGNVFVNSVATSGYAFTSVSSGWASGSQIYTGIKIGAPADNVNGGGIDLRAYTNYAASSGTEFRLYVNNTSNVLTEALRIASTGAATFSSTISCTALTETSTIKIKENIVNLDSALTKVDKLQGVSYNRKGSSIKEIGLIAEAVEEIYPEFVQYDEKGEPIGLHYSRLTAVLIESVKELKSRIEELEKK